MDTLEDALRCYQEFMNFMVAPQDDLMMGTEQWLSHAPHDFYANNHNKHRIISHDTTVRRIIVNHDIIREEVIDLENYAITISFMDYFQDGLVKVNFKLIESFPGHRYGHKPKGEDDVVITANQFYYHAASPLIEVTNELESLMEQFENGEISAKQFKLNEEAFVGHPDYNIIRVGALIALQELKDDGVITEEQYLQQKKKHIKRYEERKEWDETHGGFHEDD